MAARETLFRIFYTVGFTPWDGHPQSATLRNLVEGTGHTPVLPPGSALDLGCGTGDASIYLARHGWHVTGVDFVGKA
ncbi:methyltransferase domain-containing protein, partial [Mycobacterium sp.]|uniref:class I SAM-dependent methyltransferase n=1 Tax=Mycobacterium sp. TaxID=1785 RepID=UPI00126D31B7